jgi:hypothetical protein
MTTKMVAIITTPGLTKSGSGHGLGSDIVSHKYGAARLAFIVVPFTEIFDSDRLEVCRASVRIME